MDVDTNTIYYFKENYTKTLISIYINEKLEKFICIIFIVLVLILSGIKREYIYEGYGGGGGGGGGKGGAGRNPCK